jgi:hypothetical protein
MRMTTTPPEDDIETTNGILPLLPVLDLARLGTDDTIFDNDEDEDDVTGVVLPPPPWHRRRTVASSTMDVASMASDEIGRPPFPPRVIVRVRMVDPSSARAMPGAARRRRR